MLQELRQAAINVEGVFGDFFLFVDFVNNGIRICAQFPLDFDDQSDQVLAEGLMHSEVHALAMHLHHFRALSQRDRNVVFLARPFGFDFGRVLANAVFLCGVLERHNAVFQGFATKINVLARNVTFEVC